MTSNNEKKNGWNITRREFLSCPFSWIAGKSENQEQGEPIPYRLPLKALRHIPKPVLMSIRPVLRHGWSVRICESSIEYEEDSGDESTVSLGAEYCAAVRYFDESRTLEQIAAVLSSELGIDPKQSASVVSEAFLTLAELEIYHPDSPLDPSAVLSAAEGQGA